ncbi:MAG: tetratricopeptide repeat protein, partial [Deltaproteobacteria bacterium]|nr:tetratricopeptide repeat protein [Deltaproteobacteria bacterium]
MKCPICGAHNRSLAVSCVNCGRELPAEGAFERAPSPRSPEVVGRAPGLEEPLPTPPPVPREGAAIATPTPLPPVPAMASFPAGTPPLSPPAAGGAHLPAPGIGGAALGRSSPAPASGAPLPPAPSPSWAEDSFHTITPAEEQRTSSIPDLESVAIKDGGLAASPDETTEITRIQERRRLDQCRFEDLAGNQRPWSFHGVITRMVGRAAELDALHDAWRTAVQNNRLVLLLISGPVGIGKTRLLDDFALQLERSGRSFAHARLSLPEGAADLRSAILAPLLRSRFDLTEDLAPAQAMVKLRRELSTLAPQQSSPEMTRCFTHLLGLSGVAGSPEPRLEAGSEGLEGKTQRMLARFFLEEARTKPMLWVIDDLERAGRITLDALHGWCCSLAAAPILVVGLATPEVLGLGLPWLDESLPRSPADAAEPILRRVNIGPLSEAEMRRLIESFLGHRDLPDALQNLACSKSHGNPLALEQVLELLVEHEVITRPEQGWQVDTARLAEGDIPMSLEGLVEARLQQLAPEELAILRRAAVQGTSFCLGSIMACSRLKRPASADELWFDERLEQEIRQHLIGLQSRDVIKFLRQGPFPGELQFEFRHAFEREWIYRRSPEVERAQYHRLHAQWLEVAAKEAGRPMHETVARHFEAGGALRRAAFSYLASARQAAAAYRNEEAVFFLRKVVGFFAADDAATRGEAYEEMGKLHYGIGDYPAAVDAYQRMLYDAYILGIRSKAASAYEALGRALTDQGSFVQAERSLTRSLNLYEQLEARQGIATALDGLGQLYIKQGGTGSLDKAQRNFERSLHIRTELSDELGMALSYHLLGWVYTDRGFTREARLCFREAIRLRSAAGDKDGLCRSLNNLAETYRVAGEVARARPSYEEAYRVAEEIGAQGLQAVIIGNLAECDMVESKLPDASRRVKQALALSSTLGDRPLMVYHLIIRSKLRQLQGDGSGARAAAEEALRILEQLQGTEDLGPALRRLGEILARSEPGQEQERDLL